MADSRDIVVSVNVIRDPRGAVIQTQLIKNEAPYVKAGTVVTIKGKDGSLIYTGSGVPSNILGIYNDLYIDTVAPNNFYQKNMLNVWVLKGNLQGGKGDDGREVLIQNNGTYIQWKYDGDVSWTNIVALSDLKGDTGSNIELQKSLTHIQWRVVGDVDWTDLIAIADLKGADGRGIVSIIKTSTVGLVDTYTITYSDTTTSTFDVTNGTNGEMNVIEEVQVNSVPLEITDKSVNIVVPTQPSDIGAEPANSNIQAHISDETIHHTIEELNLLYADINHNHNLDDLTEKSYNSLTDKPDLSSLHTHANKEDLDNYDPDNFEPANSNIQEHISNTDIHIDSSSELGEDINESTHSLLLWNGLKALKVTFARMKTWIGGYFLKLDQSTPQTLTDSPKITSLVPTKLMYVDANNQIKTINAYYDPVKEQIQIGDYATVDALRGLVVSKAIRTAGSIEFGGNSGVLSSMNFLITRNDVYQVKNVNKGENSAMSFHTKNVEAMRIDPNQNVCVGGTDPKSKMDVRGGVRCGDDTAAASADKEFTIRGRKGIRNGNIGFSVTEMCMQTDVNTWDWVEVVRNEWIIP